MFPRTWRSGTMFMLYRYGYSTKGIRDEKKCNNLWEEYVKTKPENKEKLLKYSTIGGLSIYTTIISFFEEVLGKELRRTIIIGGQMQSPLLEYISRYEPVCEAVGDFSYTIIVKVDDKINLQNLIMGLDVALYELEDKYIGENGFVVSLRFKLANRKFENYDELIKTTEKKKKELEEIVEEANKKIKEFIKRHTELENLVDEGKHSKGT